MFGRLRIPRTPVSASFSSVRLLLGLRHRSTTSSSTSNSDKAGPPATVAGEEAGSRDDPYRQIQNLDFMTAAKILFTSPPKQKKFGLDFHLVQLFFACMPSLAVYLVALYARHEIRRMEAEAELKKKQAEEEAKAKEAEASSNEEESELELSKVIVRLDALEEVVKEIVDEKKKAPSDGNSKKVRVISKEEVAPSHENSSTQSKSKASEPAPE